MQSLVKQCIMLLQTFHVPDLWDLQLLLDERVMYNLGYTVTVVL
jgi:hypothetical protein